MCYYWHFVFIQSISSLNGNDGWWCIHIFIWNVKLVSPFFAGATKNLLFIVFQFIFEYAETMIVLVSSTFVFGRSFFVFFFFSKLTLLIAKCPHIHIYLCACECVCVCMVSGRYGFDCGQKQWWWVSISFHLISYQISINVCAFSLCFSLDLVWFGFILTIGCRLHSKSITHSNFYRHIAHHNRRQLPKTILIGI